MTVKQSSLLDKLLSFVANTLKSRSYIIWTNGDKYLQRTYLKHKGIFPEILLHKFYASDSDRHLHNHPWKWAKSLILSGSYKEERYWLIDSRGSLFDQPKVLSSLNLNSIKANDYHRVTLLSNHVWTLFVAGPRIQSWGFWVDDKHVPWQEYTELHNNYVTDLDGNITQLPE